MGKGMGPWLCIAHVCLDRIVSSFDFYMREHECMNMCDLNVLCERSTNMYVYAHTHE